VLAGTLVITLWHLLGRELVGPGSDRKLARTLVTYGVQSQVPALALILAYRSDLAGLYGPGAITLAKIATASSLAYWILATVQMAALHRTARWGC